MNYSTALLTTVTLASFALPSIAAAQSAKDIVGTWTLVAAETTMPDGKKTPSFGTKPDSHCPSIFPLLQSNR